MQVRQHRPDNSVFDVLHLDGQDLTSRPYTQRRAILEDLALSSGPIVVPPVWQDLPGAVLLAAAAELDLEGAVFKRSDSTYHAGRRSRSWIKCPIRKRADRCSRPRAALAVSAARAGSVIDGVPVVAVGGRSFSLAAGLLSESTVWAILRRLRETPGAPILLIAKGSGLVADRYALTTPDITDPTPDDPGRPAVTDVHPAWAVLGHQHRRIG